MIGQGRAGERGGRLCLGVRSDPGWLRFCREAAEVSRGPRVWSLPARTLCRSQVCSGAEGGMKGHGLRVGERVSVSG